MSSKLKQLRRTISLGAVGAALCLLNCSKLIGLQDGKTQGPCSTNAECAPGYQCLMESCSACASAEQCGSNVNPAPTSSTGGEGGSEPGSAGSSPKAGSGGQAVVGPGEAGAAGESSIQGGTAGKAGAAGSGGTAGAAHGGVGGSASGAGGTAGAGGSTGTFKNYEYTGTWPTQPIALQTKAGKLTYNKVTIHERFLAESCSIGDYNNDGVPDVSSGRRWYEQQSGLQFVEHIFRGGHDDLPRAGAAAEIATGVSDDPADYPYDMDGDGLVDIINIASPDVDQTMTPNPAPAPQTHATAVWYKNPGAGVATMWTPYPMHADVRLEQHGLVDVDGDGKPEIFGACKSCSPAQTKGYYSGNWAKPTTAWTYHAVTQAYTFPFGGLGLLHGEGFGDINKDGTPDLLERGGAWIDPKAATPNLVVCPAANCGWVKTNFYSGEVDGVGNRGPSQIFAADLDGDGDNDVVAADWAHGWGLAWYEQTAPLTFTRHQFMGSNSAADIAKYGTIAFSEPHALQVADMDGDGIPDIITGKMHFALPITQNDPDPNGTPYLYVFKVTHTASAVGGPITLTPMLVDSAVGVGAQLAVGHINTDGIPDICVASKLGLYVFLGQ